MSLFAHGGHEAVKPAGGRDLSAGTTSSTRYEYMKRGVDLVVGMALLIVISPVLLAIALMIVVDSGWPVLYRQERVGARRRRRHHQIEWEERRFQILKFRTMVNHADSSLHERFIESFISGEQLPSGEDGAAFKLADDPRVTRVGRVLRASSLDELPQLFNVLCGTMSLVGPRPVPPYEVALYAPRHYRRLAALPGITGIWQIEGRGRVDFEEMIAMDIDYLRQKSLWVDIRLLLRTIPAVIGKRGAR